jgi:hypothetical protein
MFIAVYFNHELPDNVDREDVEDLILDCFERAKVTGGGSDSDGCNVDVEVKDAVSAEEALRRVREGLRAANVDRSTEIQIEDQFYPLYPE